MRDYQMMDQVMDIVRAQRISEFCDLLDELYNSVVDGEDDIPVLIDWVMAHSYTVVAYLASLRRRAAGTDGIFI